MSAHKLPAAYQGFPFASIQLHTNQVIKTLLHTGDDQMTHTNVPYEYAGMTLYTLSNENSQRAVQDTASKSINFADFGSQSEGATTEFNPKKSVMSDYYPALSA